MSVQREAPRGRRVRDEEFDLEEQEVDVRTYWNRIVRYWWLPVAGLLIGLLLGLLLAAGGKQVYKAETTLYLGQAFNPSGTAPVTGLGTNPSIISDNVHSEDVIRRAAIRSGMKESQIRSGVTTRTIAAGRRVTPGTNSLVVISVKGPNRTRVERATNAIAKLTIGRVGVYVNTKIDNLEKQYESKTRELETIDKKLAIANQALTAAQRQNRDPFDQLVLASIVDNAEQRRAAVEGDQLDKLQLLNLARQVEKPQVVQPAVALKTTARSRRNSMLAGALLGLLLGTVAALLWEPVAERRRRR
jgi:hypothetical protein